MDLVQSDTHVFLHCSFWYSYLCSNFFLYVFLGKVAMDELMRMCVTQRQEANKETEQENIQTIRLKLQTLWKV